jgi:adenylosuccinate lyase
MGMAFGHAILALIYATRGVRDILINDKKIEADMAANGQFLSELVQLVERDKGASEGYDMIKQQTRGKRISYAEMEALLLEAGISQATINTYVKGKSSEIAKRALERVTKLLSS